MSDVPLVQRLTTFLLDTFQNPRRVDDVNFLDPSFPLEHTVDLLSNDQSIGEGCLRDDLDQFRSMFANLVLDVDHLLLSLSPDD